MPLAIDLPQDVVTADYGYTYPHGLNLRPGSETHNNLVRMILDRGQVSYNYMSQNWTGWQEIDRKLRAYVPSSRIEARRTAEASGEEYNFAGEELVIPLTYAILQAHTTYMMKAFLDNPVFRYEGVGPEDVSGAAILEFVINHQFRRNSMGVPLYISFRDAFAYGFGAVSPMWDVDKETRRMVGVEGDYDVSGTFQPERVIRTREEVVYQGNKLYNIDPYRYLPDPSVSVHSVQDGEFVGWTSSANLQDLLAQEMTNKRMFNVKYLDMIKERRSTLAHSNRRAQSYQIYTYQSTPAPANTLNPTDILWMYVKLIPSQWELGDGKDPELWMFQVGGDKIILQAHKMDLDHGMFPVATCAPDFDGYTPSPASRISIVQDLQEIVDFLFSSRIKNIRKSLNGVFIVDPFTINLPDLNRPEEGKIVRLRKSVWGKASVSDAMAQLDVQDITQGHTQDIQFVGELMQQVTSAQDQVLGFIRPRTSRVSASEVQGARSSSLSRLEATAQIISMQMMNPLAKMLASQTIQFMDGDVYYRLAKGVDDSIRQHLSGSTRGNFATVNPFDISVNYDVLSGDGTVPGSQNIEGWIQLYQILAQNPLVAQQVDMLRIFQNIARELGIKNIDNFITSNEQAPIQQGSLQVGSDEEIASEVAAGNLVPVDET